MLRLLIADGNDRAARDRHVAATGRTSAESYAAVVRDLVPETACRLVNPADADANLPAGLSDFDGLIFTGSTLKVGEGTPEVTRQLDLMRSALEAGLPVFGSCWGVQVAATVAGGKAAANPRGPEYGFARAISPTEEGRDASAARRASGLVGRAGDPFGRRAAAPGRRPRTGREPNPGHPGSGDPARRRVVLGHPVPSGT